MRKVLLISVIALYSLSSCNIISNKKVHGDGNVTTQNRAVTGFDAIEASGSVNVYVSQDSAYSVKVEVDNNLQQYIEVYLDGSTLRVRQANNTSLDMTKDVKVYVSGPSFRRLGASGACCIISQKRLESSAEIDIDISGACDVNLDVKAPKIGVDMSGACVVELKGETKDLEVDGSGSTDLKAFGLLAENVDVGLSGAGNAQVYASVKLDASSSGAASIEYKGAAAVNTDVSGAGSVKKRN